jgi:hypothetical protein
LKHKKEEIEELKAFLKAKNCYVATENMGYCKRCGKWEDLRFGLCFDCVFPLCPLPKCEEKRIVKQVNKTFKVFDYRYTDLKGKVYCTRNEGLCSLAKFKRRLRK